VDNKALLKIRRWEVKLKNCTYSKAAILFFALGIPSSQYGCARHQDVPTKPIGVKDLIKIKIDPVYDSSNKIDTYKITEIFKLTADGPEKTVERLLPKADIHSSADYKADYSNVYTAQMLFDGEGYVTMEIGISYECGSVTDVVLSRYFIQDGFLVKKTLIFPKESEGCSDGGNYYMWVMNKKSRLCYSGMRGGQLYDLATFKTLNKLSEEQWNVQLSSNDWEAFEIWLKEGAGHSYGE